MVSNDIRQDGEWVLIADLVLTPEAARGLADALHGAAHDAIEFRRVLGEGGAARIPKPTYAQIAGALVRVIGDEK